MRQAKEYPDGAELQFIRRDSESRPACHVSYVHFHGWDAVSRVGKISDILIQV